MSIVEKVTSIGITMPLGYYDYCYIDENGGVNFGDEQGNYSGGDTLCPDFYDSSMSYYECVINRLDEYKRNDINFYNRIIEMLTRHNIDINNQEYFDTIERA